jgi:hypothetical protein
MQDNGETKSTRGNSGYETWEQGTGGPKNIPLMKQPFSTPHRLSRQSPLGKLEERNIF